MSRANITSSQVVSASKYVFQVYVQWGLSNIKKGAWGSLAIQFIVLLLLTSVLFNGINKSVTDIQIKISEIQKLIEKKNGMASAGTLPNTQGPSTPEQSQPNIPTRQPLEVNPSPQVTSKQEVQDQLIPKLEELETKYKFTKELNFSIINASNFASPKADDDFKKALLKRFTEICVVPNSSSIGWKMSKTRIYFLKKRSINAALSIASWMPGSQDVIDYEHQLKNPVKYPDLPNGDGRIQINKSTADIVIVLGNDYSKIN
ncbi:MAG: hypothetical protein RM022_006610 [Nostoc sp. EfeVER01]|uniref:hypothetical protein n=1 Tax=unclassified Nostoc TaxID=2593658 RepID=UPI002AD2D311|nr:MULTISPECIES: hypothetical protein [unclassified Nostoc]MDZ7948709.1 hypothetical protein [Nostoc sp. EfeVER01]MDZ7991186.1 hypothetical protein [Nostoc sp. EspVER01]